MVLQELDLCIQHRSGKANSNADALSRCPLPSAEDENPTEEVVAAVQVEDSGTPAELEKGSLSELQRRDRGLAPLICYLEDGTLPDDKKLARRIAMTGSQFVIEDGALYRIEADSTLRVVVPEECHKKLFEEVHVGRVGAHLSDVKVHSELRRHYWWTGMRRDITSWTRASLICATHSPGRRCKPPLTPIPVSGVFDRIGVDVLQLPRTKRGNRYAVVVVDYLTKWPEVYATQGQSSATISRLLVEEVVSRHGVPSEILSDRGKSFLSGLMRELETLLGYRKVNMTAYHPQRDGLVERYNRTLTAMLAKSVHKGGPEWDELLPYVLFAYRTSQQTST